ncbi:MAG: hypothetical protein ACI9NT_001350 [Bacteroidia bacterium]
MIRKALITLGYFAVVAVAGGYVFRAPLWEKAQQLITADMYIDADTDAFSPGLAVGDRFPAIRANYDGGEISAIDSFVHDKGMIFIANRSADW